MFLHPRLESVRGSFDRAPLHADDALDAELLVAVAREVASLEALWRPVLRHNPDARFYERLLLTGSIEVWLLGWAPGQGVRIHDHGGAWGAFTVVEGALLEAAEGVRTTHRAGSATWFGPRWTHSVANASRNPSPGGAIATSIHAYSPPSLPLRFHGHTVNQLLAQARSRLVRLGPTEAAEAVAAGALLVDIRPAAQRRAEGEIPGALVIERNVLEWRLDPASDARIPEADGYDRQVIVMCSEGYTSSLAAASLNDLGLYRATDLAGGFKAWEAAGLPTNRGEPTPVV